MNKNYTAMYSHTCVRNVKHTTIPDLHYRHVNPLTTSSRHWWCLPVLSYVLSVGPVCIGLVACHDMT